MPNIPQTHRHTDTQAHRHTGSQTGRQTDKQAKFTSLQNSIAAHVRTRATIDRHGQCTYRASPILTERQAEEYLLRSVAFLYRILERDVERVPTAGHSSGGGGGGHHSMAYMAT